VFSKVNQPSNPSVCCQRDKLYTNPSFVVAFLNPCFSSLYLQVYSDTKYISIVKVSPIKLEQIRPKKYVSKKYCHAKSGTDFCQTRSLHRQSISGPDFALPANINFALQTPILSHFHNNLYLDSKLVMMPI